MILGLTGGIATGKSSATKIFKDFGASIIDADKISRDVAKNTEIIKLIKVEFGSKYVNSLGLNREKLREDIFPSKEKLNKLNSIMHPKIISEINKRIKENNNDFIIVDIPLLFEIGFESNVDKTLVISIDREMQLKRLMRRDDMDSRLANIMIDLQMPLSEKESKGDIVIYNNSTLLELKRKIKEVFYE